MAYFSGLAKAKQIQRFIMISIINQLQNFNIFQTMFTIILFSFHFMLCENVIVYNLVGML